MFIEIVQVVARHTSRRNQPLGIPPNSPCATGVIRSFNFKSDKIPELGGAEDRKLHRKRFPLQPLAMAGRAVAADDELRDAPFHERAFGVGKGLQRIAAGTGEGALITGFWL